MRLHAAWRVTQGALVWRPKKPRACGMRVRKQGIMMAIEQLRAELWRSVHEHGTPAATITALRALCELELISANVLGSKENDGEHHLTTRPRYTARARPLTGPSARDGNFGQNLGFGTTACHVVQDHDARKKTFANRIAGCVKAQTHACDVTRCAGN